jgi:hypothetical protein
MSRWFRHYAGMMRDDKLVRVAIRSKQTIERVVWIWGAVLESAAEIDEDGRYDVDAAEVAYFLRADEADVDAVLAALADAGRVADNRVVKWGNRQFQSDRSKDRVAAHRQRKRAERGDGDGRNEAGNGGVTLQAEPCNAPDTETELETESPPKPPRKRRGEGKHLLPDDWALPLVADLTPKAKACAEQWTSESYETHGEAFVNYWRGRRGMNSDWRLTWCNRIVALHSQVMRDQKFGNAPVAKPDAVLLTPETLEDRARWYEQMNRSDDAAEARRQAARLRQSIGPPDPKVSQIIAHAARSLSTPTGAH